jgi:SAF domain
MMMMHRQLLHSPSEPSPTSWRVLGKRRALPNGRAVLGALLISVAGFGSFALAAGGNEATPPHYVVLARPVAAGTRLLAEDLALRPIDLDPSTAEHAFGDPARLIGAVPLGPLGSGQLLQRAEVALATSVDGTTLPPGHELTIAVHADRLPPGLRRGERVAVLATTGTGTDARTEVTVQRAMVLHVGEPGDTLATRGATRLTLALAVPTDVIETAHAAQVAEITLVRMTLADRDLPATFGATTKATATTARVTP